MTKKPATAETETKKIASCRCGCGADVTHLFIQGHDQRLISKLAQNTVYGDGRCMGILTKDESNQDIQWRIDKVTAYLAAKLSTGLAGKYNSAAMRQWDLSVKRSNRETARAELRAAKAAVKAQKATAKAQKGGVVTGNVPTAPTTGVVTPDPFEGVDEAIGDHPRQGNLAVITKAKLSNEDVDAAEAADAPKYTIGTPVRVVVGKRKRNATVHGMNQAGKVTAVKIHTNGKDTIKTGDEFTVLGNV